MTTDDERRAQAVANGYRPEAIGPPTKANGWMEYGRCGGLQWTVERYGRLTHKHGCPGRTDPWCQQHPGGCPEEEPEPELDPETEALRREMWEAREAGDEERASKLHRQLADRVIDLERATGLPHLYWLSFTDDSRPTGQQWLGGCYIEAAGMIDALQRSHWSGCNPGGAAMIQDLEGAHLSPEWCNRLITDADDVKRAGEFATDDNGQPWTPS